jgi:uncharacterized membrane protein YbjE (DUF340 family)
MSQKIPVNNTVILLYAGCKQGLLTDWFCYLKLYNAIMNYPLLLLFFWVGQKVTNSGFGDASVEVLVGPGQTTVTLIPCWFTCLAIPTSLTYDLQMSPCGFQNTSFL